MILSVVDLDEAWRILSRARVIEFLRLFIGAKDWEGGRRHGVRQWRLRPMRMLLNFALCRHMELDEVRREV